MEMIRQQDDTTLRFNYVGIIQLSDATAVLLSVEGSTW